MSNGTESYWGDIPSGGGSIIATKTFDPYTIAGNNGNDGVIYFATVSIDDTTNYYAPWWVHYILEVTTTEAETQGYYDVWIGYAGDAVRYKIFNHFYSTSYYPIYHHRVLFPKSGYSAQGAHLGVRIQTARSAATLARTLKISLLDTFGCTVTFKDALDTYRNLSNSTYYTSGEYSGTAAGLQETGDSDEYGYQVAIRYPRIKTGSIGIGRYTLFMETSNGTYESITSTFNKTDTTHVVNGNSRFKPHRLFYNNSSSDFAANSNVSTTNFMAEQYGRINFNYSSNTASSLTAYEPVYLVGLMDPDGYFNLLDPWWTQTPDLQTEGMTSSGNKVYIYLGNAYNGNEMQFELNNPIYWYHNGEFRVYSPESDPYNLISMNNEVIATANTFNTSGVITSVNTYSSIVGSSPVANPMQTLKVSVKVNDLAIVDSSSNYGELYISYADLNTALADGGSTFSFPPASLYNIYGIVGIAHVGDSLIPINWIRGTGTGTQPQDNRAVSCFFGANNVVFRFRGPSSSYILKNINFLIFYDIDAAKPAPSGTIVENGG